MDGASGSMGYRTGSGYELRSRFINQSTAPSATTPNLSPPLPLSFSFSLLEGQLHRPKCLYAVWGLVDATGVGCRSELKFAHSLSTSMSAMF